MKHFNIPSRVDTKYIATLINPVDHRLYHLIKQADFFMYLVTPQPMAELTRPNIQIPAFGEAFYGKHGNRFLEFEGELGEYHRAHVDEEVAEKGKGLGFLLYSGLALSVVQDTGHAGVFSEDDDRTADAKKWWDKQIRRGYAYETVIDGDAIEYLPAIKVAQEGLVVGWNSESAALNELFSTARFPSAAVLSSVNLDTVSDPALVESLFKLVDRDPQTSSAMRLKLLSTVDQTLFEQNEQRFIRMARKRPELRANTQRQEKAWGKYFGDVRQYA